jgi:hypothetical protein
VKEVHPDAALAHHQDDPAARCSDDIVAVLRQPGACLAAHPDALALVPKEARQDATDSVEPRKVRQQGAERLGLPPQDVLPRARFPALQLAAAARRDAAQMMRAQRRVAQP